jgi:hypothetical protein
MRHEEREHWREAKDAQDLLGEMLSKPTGGSGNTGGVEFLRQQAVARPWLALGAAIVAGFVLGSTEDSTPGGQPSAGALDDELDLVRVAAMAALTATAQDVLASAVPNLGRFLSDRLTEATGSSRAGGAVGGVPSGEIGGNGISVRAGDVGGRQPSSAQNTSYATGAGTGAIGYDSAPAPGDSEGLSNYETRGSEHIGSVYPAGGARDRSMAEEYQPGKPTFPDVQDLLQRDPENPDRR